MPVAKKPVAKKPVTKKKPVAKKPVAKKPVVKNQRGGAVPAETCDGDCDKHIGQLNVYLAFLHKGLSDEMIGRDTLPDNEQIVLFSNIFLLNMATYFLDNYGETKKFTMTNIKDAMVEGNDKASKYLKFREAMVKWMGTPAYNTLLNDLVLSCVYRVEDYLIKTATVAQGLQNMFAEADLQEVSSYADGTWFTGFTKTLSSSARSIAKACQKESMTTKGLTALSKTAAIAGRAIAAAAPVVGRKIVAAAPVVGRGLVQAAPVVGRGIITGVPLVGKAAWYTGKGAIAIAKGMRHITANDVQNVAMATLQFASIFIGKSDFEFAMDRMSNW